MPFILPLTYYFLLPHSTAFVGPLLPEYDGDGSSGVASSLPYTRLATEDEVGEEGSLPAGSKTGIALSASDKWRLVKPLLLKYMLPLCEPLPIITLFPPC